MKCAYEAANGVEAHMVANMLEQSGIEARVDGEHLASGIGDLPAVGLVRVMVDERDHGRAREIIANWEAQSPPDTIPEPKRSYAPAWFLVGVAFTLALTQWLNRSTASGEGHDFNDDGQLDQRFTYRNGAISAIDGDANLDGRMDYRYEYDAKGLMVSSAQDANFDGKYERRLAFERGLPRLLSEDWDMDGSVDRRDEYRNGVLQTTMLFASNGNQPVKVLRFEHGVLVTAEYDASGDGNADTFYRYDQFGEIVETKRQ
jgi:hypothetical protein